jgi:predicted nucleic acid-binding protein
VGLISLPRSGSVYIDSQILIYAVDKHPKYLPALRSFLQDSDRGALTLITSELSILEVLVMPLRLGDQNLLNDYNQFLNSSIRLVPVTSDILRQAAELRADFKRLKTPDAIHLATAYAHKVGHFITNDQAFRSISNVPAIILDDVI